MARHRMCSSIKFETTQIHVMFEVVKIRIKLEELMFILSLKSPDSYQA